MNSGVEASTTVLTQGGPPTAAPSHRCLTAQEICGIRQVAELAQTVRHSVVQRLGAGCSTCWRAVDTVRNLHAKDLMPSSDPMVRALRTLTGVYPEAVLSPRHRGALRRVRTGPFGLLRLLFEESFIATYGRPETMLREFRSLLSFIEEAPATRRARCAWHDLRADLEARRAEILAHQGQFDEAAEALIQAKHHYGSGSGSIGRTVSLLLAQAHCAYAIPTGFGSWLSPLICAVALLHTPARRPRRLEVMLDLVYLLEQSGYLEEAHKYLLKGLRVANTLEDWPLLRLGSLHNLARFEALRAQEYDLHPPRFGLFLCLAKHHHRQAQGLYERWANEKMRAAADALEHLLKLLSGHLWTDHGLRGEWYLLERVPNIPPLRALELLGIAAVRRDQRFVASRIDTVRQAFLQPIKIRGLRRFLQELDSLGDLLGPAAQRAVLRPWLEVVQQVTEMRR